MEPVQIQKETCVGCGACVRECPQNELSIVDKKACFKNDRCIRCGHCLAVCPVGAIQMSEGMEEVREFTDRVALNPEEFHEVIRRRRTIRQYKDTPVPAETLQDILDVGRITHSGRNRQGLTFLVLQDHLVGAEALGVEYFRLIKKVGSPFSSYLKWKQFPDDFFFRGAPLAIVVLGEHETDAIYAAANMETMAEAHGLGVMVSTFFTMAVNQSPKLKKYLGIPKDKKAYTTLVMGVPNVRYKRTVPRDPLDVIYQ